MIFRSLLILIILFVVKLNLHAQTHQILVESGKVLPGTPRYIIDESRAAACAPANALRNLEWNNIEALIETGGSMWQDRATGRSHYIAPKGGGVSVLFAGALWMGGISPDQQLKLAAIQYRYEGNDYWAGPLTTDGTAEITDASCQLWDNFSVSYRADAQIHRQYHECINNPDCDLNELFPEGYTMPSYFNDYPAHGNVAAGQDYYLSPYYDFNESGSYDPQNGDYPWYDFLKEIDCAQRRRLDPVPLFGDQTYYWIFNDKGNVHTESGGQPIGMEIRAQAFAFNTTDEVNNMTFYNYVLINQGTQTLLDTYFGTWIDLDIGGHVDDFVGCDVQRGLGYGYNGYAFDAPSGLSLGYGENPPAVGVDFFEGPYQDEDGLDNPLTTDVNLANALKGIPYKGIGIGYGDSIIDNERFGMRKFLYHISGSALNGPPTSPVHYYSYLRGFWKNGQRMAYGGNALTANSGADLSVPADYMFPGDTDPYHFGTGGIPVDPWTEVSSGNPPSDRRFMQSAGPFTLQPGDYNNITVGVVYARANTGDPFDSVELVRAADDKAQALFDNCFELISGPDAPDVTVQELQNEVILFLSNENPLGSNFNEGYMLKDPTIPEVLSDGTPLSDEDRSYKFQGYLIYQLAQPDVSSADLEDPTKARLIAQCDIEDEVTDIVNYVRDPSVGQVVPQLKVQGSNSGIRHSFRITEDAFALGSNRLINHKTYYFMAIAYGHNNYLSYDIITGAGQDEPFLASRKAALGEVRVIAAIPHHVVPENGGTLQSLSYGTSIPLTQIEGKGNGQRYLELSTGSENEILSGNQINRIDYTSAGSPVDVKIVDPLRVPAADFELLLSVEDQNLFSDTATWVLNNLTEGIAYNSKHAIQTTFEELIIDWGLSVTWRQTDVPLNEFEHYTKSLGGNVFFENQNEPWLFGVPDNDDYSEFNWIRSGSTNVSADIDPFQAEYNDYFDGDAIPGTSERYPTDVNEEYEKLIGGTWAPYCLVSGSVASTASSSGWLNGVAPTTKALSGDNSPLSARYLSNIAGLNNVEVVVTPDKNLWTRCPVLEMQWQSELAVGNAEKMQMRKQASVDKNGIATGAPGCNEAEATMNGSQPEGMSWFPGYAIDVSTGERLNLAFGEDSWQAGDNGRDMLWNPSPRYVGPQNGETLFGGQHWIYVFKNMQREMLSEEYIPDYDEGNYFYSRRDASGIISGTRLRRIFSGCTWVGSAILNPVYKWRSPQDGLVRSKVRLQLRVERSYAKYSYSENDLGNVSSAGNWWNPKYSFSTKGIQTTVNVTSALADAIHQINVVPNPYYAFSTYESNKLDNRIKITNLPEVCDITIYDLNGVLIREFKKSDPLTSLDWDLKNGKNIPIASGVYIIRVSIPGVGEKLLKWFGVMRPVDLDNF